MYRWNMNNILFLKNNFRLDAQLLCSTYEASQTKIFECAEAILRNFFESCYSTFGTRCFFFINLPLNLKTIDSPYYYCFPIGQHHRVTSEIEVKSEI